MKTSILFLLGFIFLIVNPKLVSAQVPNLKDGDACKITSGVNSGKTGVYSDGWCCVGTNGTGKCTPCIINGNPTGSCDTAVSKIIKPAYFINGNWILLNDKSGKNSVITVTNNVVTVNMSSYGRPNAKGVLLDKNTIKMTFPDKSLTLFARISSTNRLVWTNGTIWTRKTSSKVD